MSRAPVSLPLNIARCPATRSRPCAQAETCARALVDGAGRDVNDYSVHTRSSTGACLSYMDAGQHRKAAAKAGPTVHEPPPGIFRG